jgi:hypothetical protein
MMVKPVAGPGGALAATGDEAKHYPRIRRGDA